MTKRRFKELLEHAIDGDHLAITELIEIYAPLLKFHSRSYGYIDEDCLQYLKMKIVMAIPKFKI